MNRCCCGKAISCWLWPDCPHWADLWREVCFRLEQACALLGADPETLLTPELLARLLASEQGGRKRVGNRRFSVVLNQADDPARIAAGEQTLALLCKKYEVQGVLTYFDEKERA
mgnify:CR=1 FL=1